MGKIAIPSPASDYNSIVVRRIAHWYINALKRDTGNIIFKTCKATKFNLTIGEQHFFSKKTCYCEDYECYTECNKIKCTRTCREKKKLVSA